MQLICEAYHVLCDSGLDAAQVHDAFEGWRAGVLDSYLMDITALILGTRDAQGVPIVEKILDCAGQKGTGRWTVEASLLLGAPVTLVAEAVFSRALSAIKGERLAAFKKLGGPVASVAPTDAVSLPDLESALYAAKIISYTQGFMLLRRAAAQHDWTLDYGSIAGMWMGGCIIRSAFLGDIQVAFSRLPDLQSLLFDDFFGSAIRAAEGAFRRVVVRAISRGVPCPGLSSALGFLDGYRTERLPANLLQAQRDLFGAHLFEYAEDPGKHVHYDWLGQGGGTITSTHYGL
jgi:6-phosphogluconate dehydrogenase